LYMVLVYFLRGIGWFLNILSWLIVINALLSWFMDPTHPIRSFLMRFVDPIVAPFRRITDRLNTSGLPIDFSPLLAYFAIMIVLQLLNALERFILQKVAFFS
jgi:YggT family protein